jgi:leucyl/phenylalanyl-tRNA--protein transferase
MPPARERFPGWLLDLPTDLVAVGADLEVDTLIEAYTKGIFPWNGDDPIRWYSPNPRMILEPEKVHVSRSLEKVIERGELRIEYDRDFRRVMSECMDVPRPGQDGTWITPRMIDAYEKLFRLGIAHSVEAYQGDELAGGLYGLTFGKAFFGESMFARTPNASKVALVRLCRDLARLAFDFVDCQQVTPHLAKMGAAPIPRKQYLARLQEALRHASLHRSWSGGP